MQHAAYLPVTRDGSCENDVKVHALKIFIRHNNGSIGEAAVAAVLGKIKEK